MVEPKLKTVYWTVTNECNQHCKHCWLSAGRKGQYELNATQWLQIFDRIIDLGLQEVKITGGEPLLQWKKIKKVLDFLMDHGILMRMETNGTLICGKNGGDILEFLERDCIAYVSVSLDSHLPSTHDEFRGMNGAFEKTLRALNLLKEKKIPLSVVTVLHKKNCGQIEDIIDFVSDIGVQNHQINIIMPEGRAKANAEYQLDSGFYANELSPLVRRIRKERGKKVSFNVPHVFAPLHIDFFSCSVGKKICGLLPNGDIAVCGAGINRRELTLGNALEDSIEDVWMNSPAFLTLRKSTFESKGICSNCIFAKYCRGYCRAHAFSVYGRLDASYPICQMLYEKGVFPEKYMIDPNRDCSFQEK